jgi:hypothetical protein
LIDGSHVVVALTAMTDNSTWSSFGLRQIEALIRPQAKWQPTTDFMQTRLCLQKVEWRSLHIRRGFDE